MPPNPNSHCQAMHDTEFTGTASAMFEHVMKIMPTVIIVVMFTDSAFTVLYSAPGSQPNDARNAHNRQDRRDD